MMNTCCKSSKDHGLFLGFIAFIMGAVILLQKFEIIPQEVWGYLWPSILLILGIKMMMASSCCDSCCCGDAKCGMPEVKKPAPKKKTSKKRRVAKKK